MKRIATSALVAAMALGACTSAPAPTPQIIYVTQPPVAATPVASAVITATPTPSAAAIVQPTATSTAAPSLGPKSTATPPPGPSGAPKPTAKPTLSPTPRVTPKPTPRPTSSCPSGADVTQQLVHAMPGLPISPGERVTAITAGQEQDFYAISLTEGEQLTLHVCVTNMGPSDVNAANVYVNRYEPGSYNWNTIFYEVAHASEGASWAGTVLVPRDATYSIVIETFDPVSRYELEADAK